MQVSLSNRTVAIMSPWPLIRLGMERFIKELAPKAHCTVAVPFIHQLQVALQEHPNSLVVIDCADEQQELEPIVLQLRSLCQSYPKLHIVFYSYYLNLTTLKALWQFPQFSLILRQSPVSQIREEMARVIAGDRVWSASNEVNQRHEPALMVPSFAQLTRTERQVLRLLQEGIRLTDIAVQCHRSIKTISAHKCNIMRKLGVRNAVELFCLPPVPIVEQDRTKSVSPSLRSMKEIL